MPIKYLGVKGNDIISFALKYLGGGKTGIGETHFVKLGIIRLFKI